MGALKMNNDQDMFNEIISTKSSQDKRDLIITYISDVLRATSTRKYKLRESVKIMAPHKLDKFICDLYLVGDGLKVI